MAEPASADLGGGRQQRQQGDSENSPHQQHQTPAVANDNVTASSKRAAARPHYDEGFGFSSKAAATPSSSDLTTPSLPSRSDRDFDAVTPGIELATYRYSPESSPATSPSYFPKVDPKRRTSLHQDSHHRITPLGEFTSMMNRRESLSDIRAANPDLSLSGNIISATFTPTHAFTYRRGGEWVSDLPHVPLLYCLSSPS